MLTEMDRKILEIFSKRLLTTRVELAMMLKRESQDGVQSSLEKLRNLGYVEKVESLGTCFVITQMGIRMMKKFK